MGKRGVCLAAGLLLMVLGGFPLLVVDAFASMGTRNLEGWAWWSAVLGRMLDFSRDSGWITLMGGLIFLPGLSLLVVGLLSAVAGQGRVFPSKD